ncbi:hypothetical protein GCK72_022403 [Caenorhabditis remanei]|uniref:Uncharacterized protein n=1 Tax=Caenorhabditis remanei TaxID=31234 RepID=A0A6A5FTY4_CAERE|nr:hypothetical protein GCK72_022403 [Caenorhabditis remanei]KAF1745955.1 hypothetical protein GCK72_022403 [Caenorhabditis remanei]
MGSMHRVYQAVWPRAFCLQKAKKECFEIGERTCSSLNTQCRGEGERIDFSSVVSPSISIHSSIGLEAARESEDRKLISDHNAQVGDLQRQIEARDAKMRKANEKNEARAEETKEMEEKHQTETEKLKSNHKDQVAELQKQIKDRDAKIREANDKMRENERNKIERTFWLKNSKRRLREEDSEKEQKSQR